MLEGSFFGLFVCVCVFRLCRCFIPAPVRLVQYFQ